MKKRILRYIKHILITIPIVIIIVLIASIIGGQYKYNRNDLVSDLNNEGPYIFFENDSLISINHIKGNDSKGYELKQNISPKDSIIKTYSYYSLDSTSFELIINPNIKTPKAEYNDNEKIFAVSDIESNYKTFRNLLIGNKIINDSLKWTFGKGHLVLVGDFIDRSYFSTQVLWFIYKLEQAAREQGGVVHYILGNHEIMNMQGNHTYAKSKYRHIASILGKKQFQLYDTNSFIGRWLSSKNTMEVINGNLFVHGGIHPEIANSKLTIDELNQKLRENYYISYYPKKNQSEEEKLLLSSKTSPYWYRGYFKEDLTQEQVDCGLNKFKAKRVIVGHNVQSQVSKLLNDKVIGIDVKHPKDYYKYFPNLKSEALLIEGDKCYRVLENGEKTDI